MPNPCPKCGAPLSEAGLCPRCLMGNALASDTDLTYSFLSDDPARILETLAKTVGPMPRLLLPDTAGSTEEAPLIKPSSAEMPTLAERSAKVQLFGEIARGGMGAVLKGRDPDLGRDLAVKVLLDSHRGNPDLIRRFVEEAQIGGQLQHPGIVPVYELGTFGDARPYFTMKLVKGRTLAVLLGSRKDPADELSRYLGIFEQIAQTVAYAHARGVIHRDLKPSNVMVGSFGEVQVMDWGLAKVLHRGGVVDDDSAGKVEVQETVIATARSGGSDSDLSHAGSVMGTPSYMAPEQARGEIDRIDERADVFALGSILCEIFTGRPAFFGRTSGEILRKAAIGDLADAFARLETSGADPELLNLTKDCLAREPEDRPSHSGIVSGRISSYLTGVQERLKAAELARAAETARAEEAIHTAAAEASRAEAADARTRAERKARQFQFGLAASMIGLMILGGGGYTWVQRQQAQRLATTTSTVDAALADANRLRGEAQAGDLAKWSEADSAVTRGEDALKQGESNETLRLRVSLVRADLDRERAIAQEKARLLETDRILLAELEAIRGELAVRFDLKKTDLDYVVAFRKAGLDFDRADADEAGRWIAARSNPVDLASHLDEWAFSRRQPTLKMNHDWTKLVVTSQVADPDPWRNALRAMIPPIVFDTSVEEIRRLADDDQSLANQPAVSLVLLARELRYVVEDRERALRVLRKAVTRYPGDFWVHTELATIPGRIRGEGDASDIFPKPEEAVRHLTAAVAIRPDSGYAHMALGMALIAWERLEEATIELREAIRLQPDVSDHHIILGIALQKQNKFNEELNEYLEAIRLQPDSCNAHKELGKWWKARGQLDKAIVACREAVRLDPNDSMAHCIIAAVLGEKGDIESATLEYLKSIEMDSQNSLYHSNFGAFLCDTKKDYSTAEVEFREAIRLNSANPSYHANLGNALYHQERYDEAITSFRESIRIDPNVPKSHRALCGALMDKAAFEEALAELRIAHQFEAKRPNPKNPPKYPPNQEIKSMELMVEKAAKLQSVLRSTEKLADSRDYVFYSHLCDVRGFYTDSIRLRIEGMIVFPKLADSRDNLFRYNGATSALLAAYGRDRAQPPPDELTRAKFRQQALEWLRAELLTWTEIFHSNNKDIGRTDISDALHNWKKDNKLQPVRDAESLAKLPEAERKDWQAFWAEVDALIARAAKL